MWALPQVVKPSRSITIQNPERLEQSENSQQQGDVIAEALDLPPPFFVSRPDLKQSVMEAIQEIKSDLEDLHDNISSQVSSHIHSGEIILTYSRSQTVEKVCYSCIPPLPP